MNSVLKVPRRDRQRVDEFVRCYNEIDAELRRLLHKTKKTSFADLVAEFERTGCARKDADCLRRVAGLRNFIVHEPKKDDDFCAVPTELMLAELVAISQRLLAPDRVTPRFAKRVETVSPGDTLSRVLRQIARRDFSQFPVYASRRFKGLLTENGITRWLAKHVERTLSLVDVDEVFVSELLREEEQRNNCAFIHPDLTTDALRSMFRDQDMLEAVLITENGQRTESPLGIVTRWDMLR
jgi:predicted transcriptional regulator